MYFAMLLAVVFAAPRLVTINDEVKTNDPIVGIFAYPSEFPKTHIPEE